MIAGMQKPAAVLFDLDGTLIDSHGLWTDGDREILAQHGYSLSEEQWQRAAMRLDGTAGVRTYVRYLIEATGADLDEDAFHGQVEAWVSPRLKHAPWKPGAWRLLGTLKRTGVPTALVTNVKRAGVDAWLCGHGHQFSATVAGDEVGNGKPHPEPYLKAAAALGVDATECVAIEDSVGGYASALAAGCRTVIVSEGRHALDNWVPSLTSVTPRWLAQVMR